MDVIDKARYTENFRSLLSVPGRNLCCWRIMARGKHSASGYLWRSFIHWASGIGFPEGTNRRGGETKRRCRVPEITATSVVQRVT